MSQSTPHKFRLYVAGNSENSTLAVANLKALCRDHLPGRHKIEIIDVFQDPKRAMADGVLMTPTLVKLTPAPVLKIVGNLSAAMVVLHTLGLDSFAA